MAYKFQVGAAVLSGSVQAEGGLVSTDVDDTTAANIVTQIDNKEIPHTKVALEDGDFLIGDGDGIAQNRTISGDATVSNTGVLTIANDAVDNDKLANIARGSIKVGGASNAPTDLDAKTSGQILVGDGTDIVSVAVSGDISLASNGAVTISGNAVEGSMINSNAAGDGLKYSSNALNIEPSDFAGTGLEDDGADNLRLSSQGTGIAGGAGSTLSVAAAQTSITSIINSSFGKLGTAANQEFIDFGESDEIRFGIDNTVEMTLASGGLSITNGISVGAGESLDTSAAGSLKLGDATATSVLLGRSGQEVRVIGDLVVQGTTRTINSAVIGITSSFAFEGSTADTAETVLSVVDPTVDRSVLLPNASGVVAVLSPSLSDAELATALSAAPSELNLMAAGTAIGSAVSDLADSDGFIVEDGNTMKKIQLSSLKTFIGGGTVPITSGSSGAADFALQKGVNVYNSLGGAATALLLTGSSMSEGESIKVKAGPDCSTTNNLKISTQGSDTIDGTEDFIVLESPNAAVEFIYVAQGDYRIF